MNKYSDAETLEIVSKLKEFGYSQVNNNRAVAVIEQLSAEVGRLRGLITAAIAAIDQEQEDIAYMTLQSALEHIPTDEHAK